MRLIDADALMIALIDADLDQVQGSDGLELCQIIDEQPTVRDYSLYLDGVADGLKESFKEYHR